MKRPPLRPTRQPLVRRRPCRARRGHTAWVWRRLAIHQDVLARWQASGPGWRARLCRWLAKQPI